MRVITGSARGRKLQAPEGLATRPTTDQVKESIFNIIQFEVPGAKVLDLFAGSGQMGIEALSRGAAFCVFIDNAPISQDVIRENLKKTGFIKSARFANMDAAQFLASTKDSFDLAFLDPPYEMEWIAKILPLLSAKIAEGGTVICETEKTAQLPEEAGDLILHRSYKYGKIKVTIYHKKESAS